MFSSQRLLVALLSLLLVVSFQNCSGGGFELASLEQAQLNSESGALDSTPTPNQTENQIVAPSNKMALPGVNISGGAYNASKAGAKIYFDYVYPTRAELDYFAAKGMKVIRIGFAAVRLQPRANGPLSATELGYIKETVLYAQSKNLQVILNPHDFGAIADDQGVYRYVVMDPLMPASYFADFWRRISIEFAAQTNVIFGLMNEPHRQTAAQWKEAAVAAVDAIRSTGSRHKILIPGTFWTGAHAWKSAGNASVWAGFTDLNFAYEVHQYLDSDSSGTHTDCVKGKGAKVLAEFTNWARANKAQGFLGEIGWADNAVCAEEADAVFAYMTNNSDVWLGYSYWSAGPWLGNYMYSIEPSGLGTSSVQDKPQMSILQKYR